MQRNAVHPQLIATRIKVAQHMVDSFAAEYIEAKKAGNVEETKRARVLWIKARNTLRGLTQGS